jgi:putative SOS response-associated peptidase YedK
MCGRYSISKKAREIGEHFQVIIPEQYQGKHFNAAPTQPLPVICMDKPDALQLFNWGLLAQWANATGNTPLIINARAESLAQKKMFSSLLSKNRCIIPADGFYEWEKKGKAKQPWRFVLKNEQLFAFAGLFNLITGPDGSQMPAFTIITTQANEMVKNLHSRMPVILSRQGQHAWLNEPDNEKLNELLQPFPYGEMDTYKVSPKLNRVAENSPEIINPWQDPNLTLF